MSFPRWLPVIVGVASCLGAVVGDMAPILLKGTDFEGGAHELFGASQYGVDSVNYIYARGNGQHSTMRAVFRVENLPDEPVYVYLTACDDDYPSQCRIAVTVGGETIIGGASGFSDAPLWRTLRFAVPDGALRVGENELVIANLHETGVVGMPPWFMVARCAIAGGDYEMQPLDQAGVELRVEVPERVRELPEPLSEGHAEPGFSIRGTKGWMWTPEQYLAEIPILARYRMNFLMNCYGSLFERKPHRVNEWWKPLSEEKRAGLRAVIDCCREHGVTFCFAVHPQLASPCPLDPTSEDDREALWQHYAWAQRQGVKWFNVSLDDVSWGEEGPEQGGVEHARLVNWVLERLRAKDGDARLSLVPVAYWGDGTSPDHRAYLKALARRMHPDVYVFWTGDAVVTSQITRQAAESYRRIIKHRLILWDNYPVNDDNPTLHLGPVTGRGRDLCEVIEGYMSNPMCKQNEANRIPLLTCADYAYNPWGYDPDRSIGQAIVHLAETAGQRRVLAALVETYPGMLTCGGGTSTSPVRAKFSRLLASPATESQAWNLVAQMGRISDGLQQQFGSMFGPARQVVDDDLRWMKQQLGRSERDQNSL